MSDDHEKRVAELRVQLVKLQYELRKADFPVLVLLAGDDRVGLAETMAVLNEWTDPRSLRTTAFGTPSGEERERPHLWRYWRALPANGHIGIFLGGWTMRAVGARLRGDCGKKGFERRLAHICRLEKTLVDGGALLLKFWLHLEKGELRKRLRKARKDPKKTWFVDEQDFWVYEHWEKMVDVAAAAMERTDQPAAPWQVIESHDRAERDMTVAGRLRDALAAKLGDGKQTPDPPSPSVELSPIESEPILPAVDLAATLSRDDYGKQLKRQQAKLHRLTREAAERGVSTVLVFEGWDAAGKGGVIRRLTAALDPPRFRVVGIAAPNDEERAHHYLWRFWQQLPRAGRVTIFDRSWYGRVLVERVEGFASETEWRRSYAEINEFESQLVERGIVVAKFWLHLDPDEQLRRFKAREKTPFKQFKITEEDYRNREKWKDYEVAVEEMLARTDTKRAPWDVVAANDKRWARVRVLKRVVSSLQKALS